MPTEPTETAPLIGRPPRGSLVHLQHDHDIRRSLCGDGVSGADSWELDSLCPTCWAAALAEAFEAVAERANDIRYGGDTDSDYWRGFNDGIDKVVALLSVSVKGKP